MFELLGLLFGELVDGNTSPQRQHLGDSFFVDFVEQIRARCLDFGFDLDTLGEQFLFAVAKATGFFELLLFDGDLFVADDVGDLGFDLLVLRGRVHALDAKT
jgi:hypothetical protein